jgi:hypothetical protein
MPTTRTTHHIGIEKDMATQAFRHFGKTNTYGDRRTDAVLAVGGRDQKEQDRNI